MHIPLNWLGFIHGAFRVLAVDPNDQNLLQSGALS